MYRCLSYFTVAEKGLGAGGEALLTPKGREKRERECLELKQRNEAP